MEPIVSCLYPNPGWLDEQSLEAISTSDSANTTHMVGKHCILELYDCDKSKLNDESFLRTAVTKAARLSGATLLKLITHQFEPQGVTGLALLAESHISIHTWPEIGYAAVDVFTCGDHTLPERACKILSEEFNADRHLLNSFKRKTPKEINTEERTPLAV